MRQALPFVIAVAVVEGNAEVVYSSDNWDIKADASSIISSWSSMKLQPIAISEVKYLIRTCTSDRLVATSITRKTHIVGAKDNERAMIAHIEPDGIIPFTTMELARTLASLSAKKPYLDENAHLGQKFQTMVSS